MKTRLLIIIAAIMLLFGCKKDSVFNEMKFEITNEEWTITETTATLTADYSWSGKVVSIVMEVSEDESLDNAKSFEASVSRNSLTVTATGLKAGTTYYYRMRLNMEDGKVESETKTFVTAAYILPTVTTSEVTNVSFTTAECGGEVREGDLPVTARGVCWNTTGNPTLDDSHTVDGSGAGAFTSTITDLTGNTTYYVRAYATSSEGTVYGETRTFETNNPNNPNEFTVNGVTFKMIYVEGGTFDMGATSEQGSDAEDREYPVHSVTLSGYYIGRCEVTQELWEAVMGSNPSYFIGAQNPVEEVCWYDCQEFVSRLNSLTGRTFRLPTEAEWEYAARGGNQSLHYKYSGSDNIGNVAWYGDNSGGIDGRTHAVGTKSPNELGIYDMSGNVWEWCSDWYGGYSAGAQTNPQGPSSGSYRVIRGGGWNHFALGCRVSCRGVSDPDFSRSGVGLRLVLVP